ncbi:Zn(2+)-responsive transcriptional regulator [Alteromonadaceae bacterium BrNp21-10]|nr:Zn(2+)-responsive transcriptional regulator [Alteromonadaceae bacterium BrNp21-10]
MTATLYKIGELAQKADVSVETLRFYETKNLLNAHSRSSAGYRLYSEQDLHQLYFILHAKKVGFSLAEIKQLLGVQVNKQQYTCEDVKHFTEEKIAQIEAKIDDLSKIKLALAQLNKACCGGEESAMHCSILHTLEDPTLFQVKGA